MTPLPGLQIINLGGHFDGSSVLHLSGGHFKKGVVLSGDTIYVVMDRRWASFMYSYANLIPLEASKVREIASRMRSWKFDDLYAGFEVREIIGGADLAVQISSRRYLNHTNRG